MRFWMKARAVAGIAVLLVLLAPEPAWAASPYNGYTWNTLGQDVRSINGYEYADSIDGVNLPTGPFKGPESIFIGSDDTIYLTDTGNSRIIHLDQKRKLLNVIGSTSGPGKLNEPKGVFVKSDGTVYVADTKNHRIALFDQKGNFLKEYNTPSSPLLGKSFAYSPSKLVVDKRDYMYVISDGNTQGLMQIDPNGNFKGFYGANHIGFSWLRLFVKLVATKEQKSQLATVNPMAFADVAQDQDGFIYTTTLGSENNQIKRLSPVGVDTLNVGVEKEYGDLYAEGPFKVASFIGVTVNKDGLITVLDLQTSKVFQYDKLGNMLFAFGGLGEQNGLFVTPSGIGQSSEGTMYVVDKGRNRIDLFRTTPFAELVHNASKLYVDGRYEESESLWKKVLQLDANFEMAYQAIGKSLYHSEHYKEAMKYFKLARNKADYSTAFLEYRKQYVREHFAMIMIAVIVLFLIVRYVLPRLLKELIRIVRKPGFSKSSLAKGGGAR